MGLRGGFFGGVGMEEGEEGEEGVMFALSDHRTDKSG